MTEKRTTLWKVLGVKNDEVVLLEEINNCTCCGELSGQIHVITMRPVSVEQVEQSWDEDNIQDYWIDAVQCRNTTSSLSEWVEQVKYESDEDVCFLDDDSYRDETEQAIDELPKKEKEKVMELMEDVCNDNCETYSYLEVSSCIHVDNRIKDDSETFYNSFEYRTSYFERVYPTLIKFSNGEIDFDECTKELEG